MVLNQKNFLENRFKVYEREVIFKYELFKSLFFNLPFRDINHSGIKFLDFEKYCNEKILLNESPHNIVNSFFSKYGIDEKSKYNILFIFLQFIEREVVLFDALEGASFTSVNDQAGPGSIDYLIHQLSSGDKILNKKFNEVIEKYKLRIVLTAHPTQFYPNQVLGIITNLIDNFKVLDLDAIKSIFLQLGLTKFSNRVKPTPYDEAVSLVWYLKKVFYYEVYNIQKKISNNLNNVEIGFWPGGDRDGNPFVTADITLKVAKKLHNTILKLYFSDLKKLQLNLTFEGVYEKISQIKKRVILDEYKDVNELLKELNSIRITLQEKYYGLFLDDIDSFIIKVQLFKFHFAKIDIRQNSSIHSLVINELFKLHNIHDNYLSLISKEKIKYLNQVKNYDNFFDKEYDDNIIKELLSTFKAVNYIQTNNGVDSIDRYIISNTESSVNVMEILFFINMFNEYLIKKNVPKTKHLYLSIVPLFETVKDLENSSLVMEELYSNINYINHLKDNNHIQTIMLGFSDGTKDGGFFMSNWAIYKAKKKLTSLAIKYNIKLIFFDGRGGPPSRGGGNTNLYYRSLSNNIASNEIHITVQGQTISTNFGTNETAKFNLEQLFTSGISSKLTTNNNDLKEDQELLFEFIAKESFNKYCALKDNPLFIDYLQEITPLKYLTENNFGSRPAKRNADGKINFEELRAIPYVASWAQMKQNILGYYGLGTGINNLLNSSNKNLFHLKKLYQDSLFFKALINNSIQSILKSNFTITQYLKQDKKFGAFWNDLYDELKLTETMILSITGYSQLLNVSSVEHHSIQIREKLILPLLVIQQYALSEIRLPERENNYHLQRLIKKSLAANINAGRNSI